MRRIIALLLAAALSTGLFVASANPADAASKSDQLVASAAASAKKKLAGSDEVRSSWVKKGSKRYGKLYVGLTRTSIDDAEHTEVQAVFVPTKRFAAKTRTVVVKFTEPGVGTETYTARRRYGMYAPTAQYPDLGTPLKVTASVRLSGKDAKSGGVNANQLS